jgi:large subunit ribosomal protein L15
VELQTSLALVQSSSESLIPPVNDPHGRTPFHHPALEGVEALTQRAKDKVTDKKQLSGLATSYGLQGVIRWKPKKVSVLGELIEIGRD